MLSDQATKQTSEPVGRVWRVLRKVLRPTQHPNRLPRIRIWCSPGPNCSPPCERLR
jgi:hypothetical protein